MDPLIYTLMSGANHTLRATQVHANNMANAQTDGFRADLELAQSQAVPGYGYSARHQLRTEANAINSRSGVVQETGRELDAAIRGDGYFAVQTDNGEAYTRSGNFEIDDQGALTVNGRPVLGDGGPIILPEFDSIAIGEDGTISVTVPGETQAQAVDKLTLVTDPTGLLAKNKAGLLVTRDGAPLPADDTVTVLGGHLERSNVSPVEEMLSVMTLNRNFEIQMRMFKSADELADAGNRLIRG